jgi:uncharacterized protein
MAQMVTLPSREQIRRIAQRIGEHFRPSKVILYGSHAAGKPTRDSDVDLLVIMETPLRGVMQAAAIRRAIDFPFPTDLLVRTPQQIEERLSLGDPFVEEILSEGLVLYEAADL